MERLRNHLVHRNLLRWLLVPAALSVFVLAGCSDDDDDDDNNPPATQTSMSGSLAGGTAENGTLAVTIQSGTLAGQLRQRTAASSLIRPAGTVVVGATGTINPEGVGANVTLSGSYNTDTDSLFLSGSGYTLRGRRTNTGAGQSIEGTYTGPNGDGAFFVLAGAGVPLQAYCGTYTSGAQADSGFFHVVVRGESLTGFTLSGLDPTDIIRLNGTVTGTGTARDIEILDPTDPGGAPLAEGTWDTSTDTMTGTYGFGGDTGNWEATLCD
jgi:hypothetical protein